jgi:hypothetical protein
MEGPLGIYYAAFRGDEPGLNPFENSDVGTVVTDGVAALPRWASLRPFFARQLKQSTVDPVSPDGARALVVESDWFSTARAQTDLLDRFGAPRRQIDLRARIGFEAVPESAVMQARHALSQLTEGALAALVFDSIVDEDDLADHHRLRFEHSLMAIELQVSVRAASSSLIGKVTPGTPVRVEVQLDIGETSLGDDLADGTFCLPEINHGVIRLQLLDDGGSPVIRTDWFRV